MNNYSDKIAILTGDPNGIGAEITIKALNKLNLSPKQILIISNSRILNKYGRLKNPYNILEIPYDFPITPGAISSQAGNFSYESLKKACEIRPKFIITAPTSKEAMNKAGHKFNGQTEVLEYFLAKDSQKAEMLFISKTFRVLLLTRHIPLKDVPNIITKDLIISKINRLKTFFNKNLSINNPSFALCSLNPHAGENGLLGNEEEKIILPAVNYLRESGVNITNPLPADTLFINATRKYLCGENLPYDCYISCYHDQGLIPIKTIAANKTVNMTIGLDIIRTSPCHGTAFDIAGKNIASAESMIEAIKACLY